MIAAVLVTAGAGAARSAAEADAAGSPARGEVSVRLPSPPPHCQEARRAVRFYTRRIHQWRVLLGVTGRMDAAQGRCERIRLLSVRLRARSAALRHRYEQWVQQEWAWQDWLPAKWYRVARCETGVRWDWDSGTYVSAFGIYRPAYAQFAAVTGTPSWDAPGKRTPHQQLLVAEALQQRYGFGAWGCGGA